MTYVQVSDNAFTFLNTLRSENPELTNLINEIEGELTLRLWHQLTEHLIQLTENPNLQSGNSLIQLYFNVIESIEIVFNPMKLMIMLSHVIKNFHGRQEEALVFLDQVDSRLKPKGEEGLFMQCLKANSLLGLKRFYDCEDILKSVKVSLEKYFDVDHIVYAYFYKLSALYYANKEKYDEFYSYALQFFAYCQEGQITHEEKLELCYKMAVASLIGEKMFNFAELIDKDFFKVLLGSKYEWVYYLILSFNSSKVDQFESMITNYRAHIQQDGVLQSRLDQLEFKIRISALLDLVFQKNKNERVLKYSEIVLACKCQIDNVELIVMRALSLGLIKGYIDEVEQRVVVNWISPKYLDKDKIMVLSDRLDSWIKRSSAILEEFENKTRQILA